MSDREQLEKDRSALDHAFGIVLNYPYVGKVMSRDIALQQRILIHLAALAATLDENEMLREALEEAREVIYDLVSLSHQFVPASAWADHPHILSARDWLAAHPEAKGESDDHSQ